MNDDGLFIAARNLQNDGQILSGGKMEIVSDNLVNTGKISAGRLSPKEMEEIVKRLQTAISAKDKNLILEALRYVGDKSVDVLLGLLTGKYLKDLGY